MSSPRSTAIRLIHCRPRRCRKKASTQFVYASRCMRSTPKPLSTPSWFMSDPSGPFLSRALSTTAGTSPPAVCDDTSEWYFRALARVSAGWLDASSGGLKLFDMIHASSPASRPSYSKAMRLPERSGTRSSSTSSLSLPCIGVCEGRGARTWVRGGARVRAWVDVPSEHTGCGCCCRGCCAPRRCPMKSSWSACWRRP